MTLKLCKAAKKMATFSSYFFATATLMVSSSSAFTFIPRQSTSSLISKQSFKVSSSQRRPIQPASRAALAARSYQQQRQVQHQLHANNNDSVVTNMEDVGFVLLAGGKGSRMKADMPKQFLTLRKKPILHHSIELFLETLPKFLSDNGGAGPAFLVLVMDPSYQPEYQRFIDLYGADRMSFANPGKERQGSVENGLNKLVEMAGDACKYVAVHDSARPLVTIDEILQVVTDARDTGAAVLGVPCKATIKQSDDGVLVTRTIPRSTLWEVHTPQVIKIEALLRGFAKVEAENIDVTDDVSIIEALGEPVKLTLGEYTNLKITTPEDMEVAEAILEERHGRDN